MDLGRMAVPCSLKHSKVTVGFTRGAVWVLQERLPTPGSWPWVKVHVLSLGVQQELA